jgi:hypothetical protein
MKKSFYVVIPYDPISVKKLNLFEGLFAKTQKFDHLKITDTDFQAATSQLTERGNVIASGLGSMGLHCFQLSTEEIIELFYQIYNPEEAGKERIADVDTLSSPVIVAKSEAQSVQTANNQQNNEAFQRSIDNASIVQEQQKEAAQQRRQEATKDGEKQMRVAQTPSPNPNSVIPNNETANNQNLPPQQPVAPQQAPMASDQQINSQTNG